MDSTKIQPDTLSLIEKAKSKMEAGTGSLLNDKIIETSKFTITVWDLIAIGVIILLTILILQIVKRAFLRNEKIDLGKRYSLFSLTRYVIISLSVLWILDILGVNLKLLLGGSAALLVGVGLGLQNLFSDFVSGIIILIDSSIKVSDIIEVDGLVCQVTKINLRTTQVLTRDNKNILLPNTFLTKNRILNWSHSEKNSRFNVQVGVDYSSDIDLVMRIMEECCVGQKGVSPFPKPFVRFDDFADSALIFTVFFWSENLFKAENIKSEIRQHIFKEFAKNNITIPFPQRTLHIQKEDLSTINNAYD